MLSPNKIISDLNFKFLSWIEFVTKFNIDMCCTKLIYSGSGPLFTFDLENDDDLKGFIPRGNKYIYLYHYLESELNDVGLQLWNSSIVMADWIIHNRESFKGLNTLELGCGVGVLSILIAQYAKMVYVTDFNIDVLQLCEFNLSANNISNHRVKLLDWNYHLLENFQSREKSLSKESGFCLDENDNDIFYGKIDLILASDVIYDDDLTDAFMRTIHDLLLVNVAARVIVFVQKRIICSYLNEECAPHFDHFVNCLDQLNDYLDKDKNIRFVVENIELDKLAQYFQYGSRPHYVYGYQISAVNKL